MSRIHFIKFSFGTNVPQSISLEQRSYFNSFFSTFFGISYNSDKSPSIDYKSIPISIKKVSRNSNILSKKMLFNLTNTYKVIDQNKRFIESQDLVVLDVKANLRELALVLLANELELILNEDDIDGCPRFIILVENILVAIRCFSSISKFIEHGKVLLIDKKKRFKTKTDLVTIHKEFSFATISKSPLDKTNFKLIRKLGHFGRYSDESKSRRIACSQFFYDGRDCTDDISDLLFDEVVRLKEKESFNVSTIFFHCPESPWLKEAILLLDSELVEFRTYYGLDYSSYQDITIEDSTSSEALILLVVDLIHTGDTVKNLYSKLKTKFHKSQIKVLSILASDHGNKFWKLDGTHAKVQLSDDESFLVKFLLHVPQIRYESYEHCPMHKDLQMDVVENSSDINDGTLTSFEVWTMCDDAGYQTEDNETNRPNPFPKVISVTPNSLKLIKENSAFLALKYTKLILTRKEFASSDLILVIPDETSNEREILKRGKYFPLEDTASGYFAETLMQLKETEYFGIPREILDKVNLAGSELPDLSFVLNDHKDFFAQLRLLPDDIIIMDEFALSGTTLKQIIAILGIVQKRPLAIFTIFNFNPREINRELFRGIEVFSLYSFNLKTK